MNPAAQPLVDMVREHDFLICIDSDGCAFDTMEVKHKECFTPNTINHWDLQSISKYAREAAEYVNLYSTFRGINRFPALIEVLDLVAERPECVRRGYTAPNIDSLRRWSATETRLGNPALAEYVKAHPDDPVMARALRWSTAVNRAVAEVVRGVPPFPFVVDSLRKMVESADVVVVSATPGEALDREWREHDVAQYTKVIAGQEMGTKKECIALAMAHGYAHDRVLMIGDAPGDLSAARANQALFYPVNPGDEEASWLRFRDEALSVFLRGEYAGGYEQSLIREFEKRLPSTPPWKA
ncbi:MAG: HAD hydrolase-like protein [Clostridiales bacterium]|nr:HAD hydrolase-like protein [Clostridiales bacterium]